MPSKKIKEKTIFLAVKVPVSLAKDVERYAESLDTDKSKLIRTALREKFSRLKQPA